MDEDIIPVLAPDGKYYGKSDAYWPGSSYIVRFFGYAPTSEQITFNGTKTNEISYYYDNLKIKKI